MNWRYWSLSIPIIFVLKLLYEILNKKTSQRVRLPEGVFDMTTAVHGIYEE